MKAFWCVCAKCEDVWVSTFAEEHGELIAMDETGESCVDCGGEVLIQEEYQAGEMDEREREVDFDF